VVKFLPLTSQEWVGNFGYGDTHYNAAHLYPDGKRVLVIAGGSDYLVNPESRSIEAHTADNICFSKEIKELQIIVLGNNICFWAESELGRKWSTGRISWDGIEVKVIKKNLLLGKCYSALDKQWHNFSLDLLTGQHIGVCFDAQ